MIDGDYFDTPISGDNINKKSAIRPARGHPDRPSLSNSPCTVALIRLGTQQLHMSSSFSIKPPHHTRQMDSITGICYLYLLHMYTPSAIVSLLARDAFCNGISSLISRSKWLTDGTTTAFHPIPVATAGIHPCSTRESFRSRLASFNLFKFGWMGQVTSPIVISVNSYCPCSRLGYQSVPIIDRL